MLHGSDLYISEKTDNVWVEKHWHNYYEIIFCERARGHCILNGKRYEMSDGSLFLLTPKDFHEIITKDDSETRALIIAFNERMIDGAIMSAVSAGPIVTVVAEKSPTETLRELFSVFNSDGKYRDQHLFHLFNSILFSLIEEGETVSCVGEDISPMVRESISLMLSCPTEGFSLDFFAKKFNVTAPYFSRLFHKQAGITFKKYLTEIRLEYAKQLLTVAEIPIIDVGYECGFNTPSQFYREFKRAFGITPSDFRRNNKR